MNLMFLIYTYNRPRVLQACIHSLFANTKIKPDRVIIIDDASEQPIRNGLFDFQLNSPDMPVDILALGKNLGYGYTAELGLKLIEFHNPKYCMVVESDYIFRKGWLEEALAVLEASPDSVGLSGYSNPDYYERSKTDEMFPRIMKEDFGEDKAERKYLHVARLMETKLGKILVQGTTNCCGTFLLNWETISSLVKDFPGIREKVFDRSCNKQPGGNRRYFGDGPFTHGLSHYWYKKHGYETGLFPWLDICDYSIANHINGDGINGKIVGEGKTFVGSPKWKDEYLMKNPRENESPK